MSHQTQNPTQNQQKTNTKPKEKTYIVVDIMDIDTSRITFGKPTPNEHQGQFIGIRYDGKTLYVKTPVRKVVFGASRNTDIKANPLYEGDKKLTGFSASSSFGKDYEDDPLFLKFKELDDFFIEAAKQNALGWGLGGSKAKPVASDEMIRGTDHAGQFGKWKMLIKYAYKKDKATNERVYQEHPPRFEIALPCKITEEMQESGKMHQHAVFTPVFYDANGNKNENVTSDNIDDVLPKFSDSSCLSKWTRITIGTYGASLKPKAQQLRVYPSESLPQDECYLDDEEEDEDLPEMVLTEERPKPAPVKAPTKPVAKASEPEPEEEEAAEEEELEEEEVEVVAPPPTKTKRKLTIKTQ